MENGENGFYQNASVIEDKNGLNLVMIDKDKVKELIDEMESNLFLKDIVTKTRIDTLRQVLPEKQDICGSELNDKEIIARECEKYGGNEMIDKIQNKAKELWGIELNNLNK